jgi:hypothetical protein
MLNEDELIKLIVSLPEADGVTLDQLDSGEYEATVDYPPIETDHPSGERMSIPDDESFTGRTPIEALVRGLIGACVEWGCLPDGSPGHLYELIERVGEGEYYEEGRLKGTVYQTRLVLELPLESGPQTIHLTDGFVWVGETGNEIDAEPPEFYEDQQPG